MCVRGMNEQMNGCRAQFGECSWVCWGKTNLTLSARSWKESGEHRHSSELFIGPNPGSASQPVSMKSFLGHWIPPGWEREKDFQYWRWDGNPQSGVRCPMSRQLWQNSQLNCVKESRDRGWNRLTDLAGHGHETVMKLWDVSKHKKRQDYFLVSKIPPFWKPLGLILPSKEKQHSQPLPSSFFLEIKISSQPIERVRKACKTSCVLCRPRRCASPMCSVSDVASLSPLCTCHS